MALFDKLVTSTAPERMTTSSLYKKAVTEPSKTQSYNPRRAEMNLLHEKDLEKLKPVIEDLFNKLGEAISGTRLASKMSQLNTLRAQLMKAMEE